MAGMLKLMTRPPNTPVTGNVAREICQRTGSKAYIGGSISTMGAQYVLELTATACASDDVLAEEQATVDRKEQVLGALGKSAARLREKLGESLASVEKFNKPLEEATTPSLEALTQYSMARQLQREQGDPAAIPYVKRALELDPQFAVAYTTLGIFYSNLNRSDLAKENLQKAYDLRDRVTQQERFSIEALYYANVTGEMEKAMQTYRDWARTYPNDYVPRDNLAVCYATLGQYDKAVPEIEESLRLEPDDAIGYGNLADDYLALNRLDDAKNVLDEASKRGVDTPYIHLTRYRLAFLQNDPVGMEAQASSAVGKAGLEDWQLSEEADTEAYYGRLRQARELTEQAVESARRNDSVDTAARWEIEEGLRESEFGNPALARKAAADALALSSNADIELLAALTLARAGDNSQASRLADKVDAELGRDTLIQTYWLPTIRAAIELNNGHSQKAIELLQAVADYDLANPAQSASHATMYPSYVRGLAYLRVGDGPQAAREFQNILDHRDMVANSPLGTLARLQLGRADRLSRNGKARVAYGAFLLDWVNADQDVPVFRQGKAEYAKLR
jgi:tetratricopeptide (TPR) repeat protein